MTITAKIIADSISSQGIRLTTMQLRYPKFIHGEFMTHRVFSRNASSSRAIPVERMIADIERDPAMPVFWGKNQAGMQAREELGTEAKAAAELWWRQALADAISNAYCLHNEGAHKQIVNRVLEPFMHINVVVTATDYENFYALRRHEDAQPEMKALADAMWEAQQASEPRLLKPGEWHLPYVMDDDRQRAYWDSRYPGPDNSECFDEGEVLEICTRLSVARCARVSYLTHEGKAPNIEDDLKLYDRLVGSMPLHASPAEHQATPDETSSEYIDGKSSREWFYPEQHGNFRGWRQYRKMLPNEAAVDA